MPCRVRCTLSCFLLLVTLATQLEIQLDIGDSPSDLRFEPTDDFAALAAEFAERWGLHRGGGCDTRECIVRTLTERMLILSEADARAQGSRRWDGPPAARGDVAVVLCGHPRSFLRADVRANVRERALAHLCAGVTCDVFMLVSTSDQSLFDVDKKKAGRRPGGVRARNVTAREIVDILAADGSWGVPRGDAATAADDAAVRVRAVVEIANPPPLARDAACDDGSARARRELGFELANAAAAFALVRDAEGDGGPRYELVARMRFDAVWIRPPPSARALAREAAPDGADGDDDAVVVVPRHHFPLNNHFALMTRAAAPAYFDAPLAAWARCSDAPGGGWRVPAYLDNGEGLLLKALLDARVGVRRVHGLYLTLYRLGARDAAVARADTIGGDAAGGGAAGRGGGAECMRLKAYKREDARAIDGECAAQFVAIDPADRVVGNPPLSADADGDDGGNDASALVYEIDELTDAARCADDEPLRVKIDAATYRDALDAACANAVWRESCGASGVPERCAIHAGHLERAVQALERAEAARVIQWKDSMISTRAFADFEISSLEDWDEWVEKANLDDGLGMLGMHVDDLEVSRRRAHERERGTRAGE